MRRQAGHLPETSVFHLRPRARAVAASPQTVVKVNREQTVRDGIEARVEEAEDKQHVSERVRHRLLHFLREQPVPQAQQVVRGPAHDERRHDDDAHLKSPHPSFGDVAV